MSGSQVPNIREPGEPKQPLYHTYGKMDIILALGRQRIPHEFLSGPYSLPINQDL